MLLVGAHTDIYGTSEIKGTKVLGFEAPCGRYFTILPQTALLLFLGIFDIIRAKTRDKRKKEDKMHNREEGAKFPLWPIWLIAFMLGFAILFGVLPSIFANDPLLSLLSGG